jgi:hypothetical protein
MNHYDEARKIYFEALGVNPSDQTAKQFLRYATKKGKSIEGEHRERETETKRTQDTDSDAV